MTPGDAVCKHMIISLVPCEGWVAVFDERDSDYAVACWAIIRCDRPLLGGDLDHPGEYIAPIISRDGEMVDATRVEGYVACEPDDGFDCIDLGDDEDEDGDDDG